MRNKIVWNEGMALSPHHFQQSEILAEQEAWAKWQTSNPHFYGFKKINVNLSALEAGVVSFEGCEGIFQDGTVFSFSGSQGPRRNFEEFFSYEKTSVNVYLSLPLKTSVDLSSSVVKKQDSQSRFQSVRGEVADINDGANIKHIDFAELNLKLFLEGEHDQGYQLLKIGQLVKNERGKVDWNSSLIPPLLQIGASDYLMNQLRGLVDLVASKSRHLMAGRRQNTSGHLKFNSEYFSEYLLLMVLNQHLPTISNTSANPWMHPQMLYISLLEFCGGLTGFTRDIDMLFSFEYNHQDLLGTFEKLFRTIENIIQDSSSENFVVVPAIKNGPQKYSMSLSDRSFSEFYLGFTWKEIHGNSKWDAKIETSFRAGPPSKIEYMITAAAAGIPFAQNHQPDSKVPVKPSYQYYKIDHKHPLFEQAMVEKQLIIHTPIHLSDLKIELVATGGD